MSVFDSMDGTKADAPWADPQEVARLRQQMLSFARQQLSDAALAEDAVQEAFAGALKNVRSFEGHAAFKTWVFAILKHKIADILRHRQRHVEASALLRDEDEESDLPTLFDTQGHWNLSERPAAWAQPDDALRSSQFWKVFETCLEALPGHQGRVFMMREFIGLESTEICEAVGVGMSNLNVMLYRARLRLRQCLENKWFQTGGEAHELS